MLTKFDKLNEYYFSQKSAKSNADRLIRSFASCQWQVICLIFLDQRPHEVFNSTFKLH